MKGKNVIVGITGGIAAYKAAILIRLLVKEGAEVQVLMTSMGKQFITPLTVATLSKRPILVDFYNPENGSWNSHVDLGLWADAMIIAPATANTIGKAANGIADNLLLTTYLSAKCPIFWVPAMDLDMFAHKAVQKNINTLQIFGNLIIDAESGELASGLYGKGRMAEPETIVEYLKKYFNSQKQLQNKKALVTAGPTYEQIDPVRFIGNYSTGKMGIEIAESLANQGAEVTLILGPVNHKITHQNIKVISVKSAEEMYLETSKKFQNTDIAVFAAAVADFRPENIEITKIKKTANSSMIKLVPNVDIALEMGKLKKKNQISVGFALETDKEIENAKLKLEKKNFDFVVLNSLRDSGAGFGHDTNKITIFDSNNKIINFELKTKKEVAQDIVDKISEYFKQ